MLSRLRPLVFFTLSFLVTSTALAGGGGGGGGTQAVTVDAPTLALVAAHVALAAALWWRRPRT